MAASRPAWPFERPAFFFGSFCRFDWMVVSSRLARSQRQIEQQGSVATCTHNLVSEERGP